MLEILEEGILNGEIRDDIPVKLIRQIILGSIEQVEIAVEVGHAALGDHHHRSLDALHPQSGRADRSGLAHAADGRGEERIVGGHVAAPVRQVQRQPGDVLAETAGVVVVLGIVVTPVSEVVCIVVVLVKSIVVVVIGVFEVVVVEVSSPLPPSIRLLLMLLSEFE